MNKIIALTSISILSLSAASAQVSSNGQMNTISTAVPFLRIAPDARSAGMGDAGIAVSADANAQYWNVAKLPFSSKKSGLSFTYTPWLKAMTPDMSLLYFSGYTRFGNEGDQAISGSVRYFNLGRLKFSDLDGQPAGSGRPNEFSIDLGYSRRLSDHLSAGLSLRYIRSSVMSGANVPGVSNKAGSAMSADLAVFYTQSKAGEQQGKGLSLGAVLSNLGSKIAYNDLQKNYLPANLGLGAAYLISLEESHQLTFALDINKLLVPTPRDSSATGTGQYHIPEKTVAGGVFSSFGDAPDGFSEELREFQFSLGAEYWYRQQFALRAGYFHENRTKGNRQYFTLGLGVKYKLLQLNGSYLIPTSKTTVRNPLANTFRISLLFEFDQVGRAKGNVVPESK